MTELWRREPRSTGKTRRSSTSSSTASSGARWSAGSGPVDSQIPTEEELCRLFDVSKATVRIAVAELVREGYLRRQQGKGTFVCKRVIPEGLSMLTSFKEIMLEAGVVFETRVLAQTVMMLTDELELKLDVPEDKHIIYLKRVRLVGEEPVLLQESYLPHAVCPALLAEELEKAVASSSCSRSAAGCGSPACATTSRSSRSARRRRRSSACPPGPRRCCWSSTSTPATRR